MIEHGDGITVDNQRISQMEGPAIMNFIREDREENVHQMTRKEWCIAGLRDQLIALRPMDVTNSVKLPEEITTVRYAMNNLNICSARRLEI